MNLKAVFFAIVASLLAVAALGVIVWQLRTSPQARQYLPSSLPEWLAVSPSPTLAAGQPLDNASTSRIDVLTTSSETAVLVPATTSGTSQITILPSQPDNTVAPPTAAPQPALDELFATIAVLHSAYSQGQAAPALLAHATSLATTLQQTRLHAALETLAGILPDEAPPTPVQIAYATTVLATLPPPAPTNKAVSMAADVSSSWWQRVAGSLVKIHPASPPPPSGWLAAMAELRNHLATGDDGQILKALDHPDLQADSRLTAAAGIMTRHHAVQQALAAITAAMAPAKESLHP